MNNCNRLLVFEEPFACKEVFFADGELIDCYDRALSKHLNEDEIEK